MRIAAGAALIAAVLLCAACASGPSDSTGKSRSNDAPPPTSSLADEQAAPAVGLLAVVNASATVHSVYESAFCGAVAVADRKALTSAHCLRGRDQSSLKLAYGSTDICDTLWSFAAVEKVEFVSGLAILSVDGAPFESVAKPATVEAMQPIAARGWGKFEDGSYPCSAKIAQLNLVPKSECRVVANAPDVGPMFCARPSTPASLNTCSGGSGGPAYQHSKIGWVLVGIIEGGSGTSDDGTYLSVTHLRDQFR